MNEHFTGSVESDEFDKGFFAGTKAEVVQVDIAAAELQVAEETSFSPVEWTAMGVMSDIPDEPDYLLTSSGTVMNMTTGELAPFKFVDNIHKSGNWFTRLLTRKKPVYDVRRHLAYTSVFDLVDWITWVLDGRHALGCEWNYNITEEGDVAPLEVHLTIREISTYYDSQDLDGEEVIIREFTFNAGELAWDYIRVGPVEAGFYLLTDLRHEGFPIKDAGAIFRRLTKPPSIGDNN